MQRQVLLRWTFSCATPNLAALSVRLQPPQVAGGWPILNFAFFAKFRVGRHGATIKAYKTMRARLNIMSAANVPTRAGRGRKKTRRTLHRNCVLKQPDSCGGWPHSNTPTIHT